MKRSKPYCLGISSLKSKGGEKRPLTLYQDIDLNDLAEAVGCNRFRLTRSFKQSFSMAPHAYLIQLRLVEARKLLRLGATPAEVAVDLCFSDQSHLGRWFRRAYRVTPAQYRKQAQTFQTRY